VDVWDIQKNKRVSSPPLRPPFVFSADGRQIIGGRDGLDTIEFTSLDVRSAKVQKRVSVKISKGLNSGFGSAGGTCGGIQEVKYVLSRTGKWGAVPLSKEGDKVGNKGAWWKPSARGGVLLFNAQTGKHISIIPASCLPGSEIIMKFSPDEKTLIIAGTWGIHMRDVQTRQMTWRAKDQYISFGEKMELSPDKTLLACSGETSEIWRLWNIRTRRVERRLKVENVSSLAFSPDGSTLATGHHNGSVTLWRVR
jgi:hypothetical protein